MAFREDLGSPTTGVGMVVSHSVGAENETWVLPKSNHLSPAPMPVFLSTS